MAADLEDTEVKRQPVARRGTGVPEGDRVMDILRLATAGSVCTMAAAR